MSLLSRLAVQAARAYGILSARNTNISADYLVVAGGASGGEGLGGGGGAGGLLTSTATLSTLNTYSITVGAGGASTTSGAGNNGSDSSISGTGLTTITSTGGGGGGSNSSGVDGKNGGSGGGARNNGSTTATGGTGTSGQGNNGGSAQAGTSGQRPTGGGGGAGAVGGNGITGSASGAGGAGSSSSISGSSVTYAGGGGGGSSGAITAGAGGSGGGGAGAQGAANATSATVNTGGGGGGCDSGRTSGAGGSGIVIISYTSATPKFVGGTITTSGGKQIHTFTSSGTLSPITPITASYLVVAGGGGGAQGGGGAGGLLTSSTTLYSGATYVVTVGAGGAYGDGGGTSNGSQGGNSVLSGTGLTTITSVGGGYGQTNSTSGTGGNGGSGGGGARLQSGGTGTSGQGNNGGTANGSGANNAGGGGGGAGAVGGNASSNTGGNGGIGSSSSISGTSTYYAGGGGGGCSSTAGTGGSGGGGNGGSTTNGSSGTPNTGGGGGGTQNSTSYNGGAGGSGVVIISYAGSQVFNGGLVTTSGGNTIHTFTSTGALTPLTNNLNNSLRFRSSASAYLNRTPTLAGNRKTWTWSGWVKRGALTASTDFTLFSAGTTSPTYDSLRFSSDTLQFFQTGGTTANIVTTQVFRDPSAWYHVVLAVDTTQATSSNRFKLYINGNQITAFGTASYPSLNADGAINNTYVHALGALWITSAQQYLDGYLTDINFIDGQALEPYYFGNNDANGVWKPIQYKGTYGTNGFYLTFGNTTSTTTLGYDSSPNGNNWTCNNISLTAGTTYDAMLDVPTNTSATVANYAVLNPLDKGTSGTLDRANLQWSSGASWQSVRGTMTIPSGKFYFEGIITSTTTASLGQQFGLALATNPLNVGGNSNTGAYGVDCTSSSNVNTAGTTTGSGSAFTAGDVLQIAIDRDNNRAWFGRNNTWYNSTLAATGDPVAGTNATWSSLPADLFPFINTYSQTVNFNFGQRAFSYTPPTGFVALNTYNLPTPTILQGNKYMDATLYTGNGYPTSGTQSITNAALFKPDLVWIKIRSGAGSHTLTDSVRGVNSQLFSNQTAAQETNTDHVTAFNSNGFSLGTGTSGTYPSTNNNGSTYVGWQWQAGQGSTSSNTSGSITSTLSVNTTAGFSVATFTGASTQGATFGHGLGVAPKMVIAKSKTGATQNWWVYHTSLGYTNNIYLNSTAASFADANTWLATPSSTLVTIGDNFVTSATYVAYCWAEIAGFSKFGSYTGNGSADGPFVYTGFRPKFIMIKSSSAGGVGYNWTLYDTSRNTYNVADLQLNANLSDAEAVSNQMDILSNGFKIFGSGTRHNGSGTTYIYMAFAENPFKNANAR